MPFRTNRARAAGPLRGHGAKPGNAHVAPWFFPPRFFDVLAHSAWAGYAFAVVATGAAILFRWEIGQLTGQWVPLSLCGLAVVLASLSWAGSGPGLAAVTLTMAWYVWQTRGPGEWIHYSLYATAAGLIYVAGRRRGLARSEAAEPEDWHRQAVENSGEGIWMVDPDGVIAYANARIAELLGCSAEQVAGHRVEDFLFPEDVPAERIRFLNRHPGIREQFDRRLRRTDGSEVWTLACSSPYTRDLGDAGLVTMMTDITERKRAEVSLRHSERKFRELFENVREGVYQTTPDGRILAANPELLRMLGFSNEAELNVVGVVRDTFVDPDVHRRLRERLEIGGSYANVEFQLRTRDHRVITVRENARMVRDDNGNVLYYEGTLTDITERIRFEKQLRQAQKMEALGRLAGGIAQDFQNVGTGMMNGLRQVLEVLPPDSPARPRLEAVARSMQGAAALTRQILDFSRRQPVAPEAIDLNSLIRSLETELRRLVEPERSLTLSLCEDRLPVLADPGHVQQIVTSLLIHAREYGAGVKRIELATTLRAGPPEEAGPASLVICSQAAKEDDESRLWVGMATTQAILAQYGGVMTAAAEPAGGVRYSLFFPLAADVDALRAGVETVETVSPAPAAGTVLLVEEEPLIRELSRDMLERGGFRVLVAGNAGEAERIARGQEHFDILITDWVASGGGSSALVRLLRGMRPHLRVLFIAGYTDGQAKSIPVPEGCAILQKPFSGDSLGRRVRQLLDQ